MGTFCDGSVSDTYDLQLFGEALRHTSDHVVEKRTSQSVQSPVLTFVIWPFDKQRRLLLTDDHRIRDRHGKLSLWTLHGNGAVCDGDVNTLRNGHWLAS